MLDLIWLNGEVGPLSDAKVGVEDRGFQFADGVYEVVRLYDGAAFTLREHLDRLARSATGIGIALPLTTDALAEQIRKFVVRTAMREGMVYLQLTRGIAPRNHVIPAQTKATLLFYVRPLAPVPPPGTAEGAKLLSLPDERWKKCWIKSIALLPNVLAKTQAVSQGYDEAVFIDEGLVTECSASNVFAVIDGAVVTHPVGAKVLPGITRAVLFDCAAKLGVAVRERPFTEEEALAAAELFITSTTREISWVSHWNDHSAGGGACGPVTLALHRALRERVKTETASQH